MVVPLPYADPEAHRAYHRRRYAALKAGTWNPRLPAKTDEERRARRHASERRAATVRYERGRRLINAAKDAPCVDCGVRLPPDCMDLDHVRGVKSFTLARWNRVRVAVGMSLMEMLAAEIAKCDPRCPNCHRLRHHRERQAES